MVRNAPLRGLRAFWVVARHSSIKNAAAEMCVTASAVSHQIKDLETRLGVQLFERGTRQLQISATGRGLFEEIDPLIRGIDQAALRWGRPTSANALRLRLPAFFASELFMPRFKFFADSQPGMDIRIETTESERGSRRAGADIAVVMANRRPTSRNVEPLFKVRLVPATAPDIARRFSHDMAIILDKVNLIVHRDHPRAWHEWAKGAAVQPPKLQRIIHLDSTASVTSAAEKGLGVALVPIPITEARFDAGNLVRLAKHELDINDRYYLVHGSGNDDRQSIQALRSWILKEFGCALASKPITQAYYDLHH